MNGIIIINKPKNYTSHDVVAKVKKILNVKKVGHTGTLDPNATGVLPLLINDGTKLSKYLIEHDKEYEVVLKLGIKTDTADIEGNIVETKEDNLNKLEEEEIKKRLKIFEGQQEQIPPIYSAIKIKGKKLYEYARNGEKVEIPSRKIEIFNIELIEINKEEKEIIFKVHCSKGTYIRTLCEDIANKLETVGYMKELNRTKVGKFKISNAITIDQLEENKNNQEFLNKNIITIKELLKEKGNIILDDDKLNSFLNGVKITQNKPDEIYNVYNKNNIYIGTGTIENKLLKRDIIIK